MKVTRKQKHEARTAYLALREIYSIRTSLELLAQRLNVTIDELCNLYLESPGLKLAPFNLEDQQS